MLRRTFLSRIMLPLCITSTLLGAASAQALSSLTASQLIDRNVAAKGGLQAWRGGPGHHLLRQDGRGWKEQDATAIRAREEAAAEDAGGIGIQE